MLHILRAPFPKNTFGGLLLLIVGINLYANMVDVIFLTATVMSSSVLRVDRLAEFNAFHTLCTENNFSKIVWNLL